MSKNKVKSNFTTEAVGSSGSRGICSTSKGGVNRRKEGYHITTYTPDPNPKGSFMPRATGQSSPLDCGNRTCPPPSLLAMRLRVVFGCNLVIGVIPCVMTVCRGSQSNCKVHLFVDQVDWFDLALNWPESKASGRVSAKGASTKRGSL